MTMIITELLCEDWPAVCAIYQEGMHTGLATFETQAPAWEDWDSSHLTGCRLAARKGDRLVGWAA